MGVTDWEDTSVAVIIEGVKIEMSTTDLRAMLNARADWHQAKHKRYLARIDALNKLVGEEAQTEEEDDEGNQVRFSASNYDQKAGWSQKADSSKTRAGYFRLLAKYLVPDATYQLTNRDIEHLELASQLL